MLEAQSPLAIPSVESYPRSRFGGIGELKRLVVRKAQGFYVCCQGLVNQRVVAEIQQQQGSIEQLKSLINQIQEEQGHMAAELLQLKGDHQRQLDSINASMRCSPDMTDQKFALQSADGHSTMSFVGNEGQEPLTGYDHEVGFMNTFRGPESMIKERQRVYLQFLKDKKLVIDCGSGRGEFLELARENGIAAVGLELNPVLIDYCRSRGLDNVIQSDGLSFIETIDRSPDGIYSCQVVEHFDFDYLYKFICLSQQKLQTGGVFIAETVNPHCAAARKLFPLDPTHVKPLFPELMLQLCQSAGFSGARIFFPDKNSSDYSEYWQSGDYAIVATK